MDSNRVVPIDFYLVGGVARGKKPRDIDIVGVMSNEDFERIYGISANGELYNLLVAEKDIGFKTMPDKFKLWRAENTGMRRVIEQIYPYHWVDYKVIPENMLNRKKPVFKISLLDLEKYR